MLVTVRRRNNEYEDINIFFTTDKHEMPCRIKQQHCHENKEMINVRALSCSYYRNQNYERTEPSTSIKTNRSRFHFIWLYLFVWAPFSALLVLLTHVIRTSNSIYSVKQGWNSAGSLAAGTELLELYRGGVRMEGP